MDLNTQEVHLSHYWNVIYKRWKVAVSILAVVMIGTYVASRFAKPLYRSSIQIQIERENPNQLTVDDLFGIASSDQEFLQTQFVLLKGRGLAEKVIDEQKLLSDPSFYPPGIGGKTPAQLTQARESMVGGVIGSLDVQSVRGTSLVEVASIAQTPQLAQKIAEGVGESYIRLNNEKKFESVQKASEFLERQIAQLRADIEVTRQQMQQFGATKGVLSKEDASSIPIQRLMKLNNDAQTATQSRLEKQNAYDALSRANPESVTGGDPPAEVQQTVSATIGGLPADIKFKGLTPGSVGLYQINTVVPTGIPPGSAVPIVISVGGQVSQPGVTIAVRN